MPWTLAVDFGTSNTTATIATDDGPPQRVRLSSASDSMPSSVLVERDVVRVGASAVHARRVRPESFVEAPKALLGQESTHVAGRDHSVPELAGHVFAYVARAAGRMAGSEAPDRVVLTHPQDWARRRRDALVAAWEAAGIPAASVELVSEPVAAASWLVCRPTVEMAEGARIAVLDYGGGTCDVSILQWTGEPGSPWQELGSAGAPHVGGSAIDQVLLSWVRETLHRGGGGTIEEALDDPANIGALRTLVDEVRAAKEILSEVEHADIPVAVGDASTWVSITADEFEAVVGGEVAKVRAVTDRALATAGVSGPHLDTMFLTGGSSLLRPVQRSVADLLGQRPATLDDPKLVVALGAHLATRATSVPAPRAPTPEPVSAHRSPTMEPVSAPRPTAQPGPVPAPRPDAEPIPRRTPVPTPRRVPGPRPTPGPDAQPVRPPLLPPAPAALVRIGLCLLPAWLVLSGGIIASQGDPENAVLYLFLLLAFAGVAAIAVLARAQSLPEHRTPSALLNAGIGFAVSVLSFVTIFTTSGSSERLVVWAGVAPFLLASLLAVALFLLPPVRRRLEHWTPTPGNG